MNIVKDSFFPVKVKNGGVKWLRVVELLDDDCVDFALPRPDLQSAAYQLVIGLLQTAFAPEDTDEWLEYYQNPPSQDELTKELSKIEHAFNVVGDGPLFMQDYDSLEDSSSNSVAGLFIDSPGDNALKNNTDHFVKRGLINELSIEMATLSLFNLQANAPSGGQGHRTGLRGGGPISTFLLPDNDNASLWNKLWLNVISLDYWGELEQPDFNGVDIFPWLAPCKTSEQKGSEVYYSDVHPLHVYWSMPRRIRLELEKKESICDLTGCQSNYSVSTYRTKNYGYNYEGWQEHPFTTYKFNPKKPDDDYYSLKAQPGGLSYRHWDQLLFDNDAGSVPPQTISHYYEELRDYSDEIGSDIKLWASGYDMDNMKPRCFYNSEFPYLYVSTDKKDNFLNEINGLQEIATAVIKDTVGCVKKAWSDNPKDLKGDASFINTAFWQKTEQLFFDAARNMIEHEKNDVLMDSQQAILWINGIKKTALGLFDQYAFSEFYVHSSTRRVIEARKLLKSLLAKNKHIKNYYSFYDINENEVA